MKSFRLLTLLALCGFTAARAQTSVAIGTQVTAESNLVSGNEYVIQSQASGTPYVTEAGTYYALPNAGNQPTTAAVYAFIKNDDGTWKIRNHDSGKYWGVPVYNQPLTPSAENTAGAWSMNFSGGIAYPSAPDAEGTVRRIDRSSQKLVAYTQSSSVAQRIKIFEIGDAPLSNTPLAELEGKVISVGERPAADLATGQWYVMFDRGKTNNNPHGYLYEQVSSHTLYNTVDMPAGRATTAARYLVRLSDADEGRYFVQTGFGNYFGPFTKSTAVPVTATPKEAIKVAKIANTDGHFYLQTPSTGVVLDANSLERGDATVVGWASAPPTSIGGNNDWAFYPVAIEDIGEEIALFEDNVVVARGYQTCGRGNSNAVMLRIDVTPSKPMSAATFTVSLNEAAQANLSDLMLYETASNEFLANIPAAPIATADVGATASLNITDVAAKTHHYWLCATVNEDAALGAILEASLTNISYTTSQEVSLDVSAIGRPSRQGMKVFAQQHFVFKPTSDNCRFYRIPAMVLDADGNLVVAIDKRYNSNSDLGNHKIDVVSLRSEDGGRSWQNQASIATGDGSTAAYFGYGDAALARAVNGDLVCIMAAGSKMWGSNADDGMKYAGFAKSTSNGKRWTLTRNLFTSNHFYDENSDNGKLSMANIFTTSGKGLTTNDGVIMFTTNCRTPGSSGPNLIYVLYSTDNGANWRMSNALAYSGGDESKLEQLNDGSLLLSVRQSGDRGWNTATYTKNDDGTVTFHWGSQYRASDIWGNACNADILYYSRATDGEGDILLHSYINTGGRESLQLAMSLDQGRSWHSVYNIQPNGSCYSTMMKLPDGTLAILYEDASYDVGNGYAINFVTITPEQILEWFTNLGGVIPDGIKDLTPDPSPARPNGTLSSGKIDEGSIYSVGGQRLSRPQKGVNIIDGKKVVKK